jgi:DNA-binding transcriptional regulator YiaG
MTIFARFGPPHGRPLFPIRLGNPMHIRRPSKQGLGFALLRGKLIAFERAILPRLDGTLGMQSCGTVPNMPNIASVLKEEITRLARKELKANTESIKKAVATYRSEIAGLKRRVDQLERQAKKTAKVAPAKAIGVAESDGQHRWRAAGFAQHRKRLGLSAADCAKLLGVSSLSVYKWEGGQARPRAKYLPAIAALRGMGKREAAKRLGELQ